MNTPGRERAFSLISALLAGLILFGYGLAISIFNGVSSYDESWFLQVVSRMLSGETLYRDIFFGVTPLSAYLTIPIAAVFGVEMVILKAISAGLFALTALVALRIGHQLGLSRGVRWALVLATAGLAYPLAAGLYTPLAILFLVIGLSLCLSLARRRFGPTSYALAGAVGAATGLVFLSKQNTGGYVMAAVGLSFIAIYPVGPADLRRRLIRFTGHGLYAAIACAVVIIVGLVPTVAAGGWDRLIDYGFANKSTYVAVSGLGYLDQFLAPLQRADLDGFGKARVMFQQSAFIAAPLALSIGALIAAAMWAARRRPTGAPGPRDPTALTITLWFSGAAFINAFPRVDAGHLLYTMPTALILLAASGHVLSQDGLAARNRLRRGLVLAAVGVGLLAIINTAEPLIRVVRDGEMIAIPFPHFSGMLFRAADSTWLFPKLAEFAAARTGKGPLFLMIPNAGFVYLTTGTRNPTPFDYPFVTAFGQTGEADLTRALANRTLSGLCHQPYLYGMEAFLPATIEHYVQTAMTPSQDLGLCMLYTTP